VHGVTKLSDERIRVFSGTLFNFINSLVIVVLTAANTIIIANTIGSQLYGSLSLGVTLLDLFTGICAVGMGASMVRFLPDFLIRKKFSSVNTAISTASIVVLSITAVLTVVGFFLSPFIAIKVFNNYWLTPIFQLLIVTSFPLLSIKIIFQWILSGFQRFDLYTIVDVSFISSYLLFAYTLLGFGFSIEGVIYAFALAYAFSGSLGFVFSLRVKRKSVKSDKGFKIFDFGLLKEMFNFGKWDYGMGFMELGFTHFNKIFVGVFLAVTAVGVYAISQTFASVLGYIGIAVTATLNPYLSELTAINMKKKVVNLMKKSIGYSFILSILFSAPIIVFSEQILGAFFTQQYLSSADPAKILIIGFVISSVSRPAGSYFFARKKLWVNFSILLLSLLAGVALSLLFIPVFSMNGLNQTWGMIGTALARVSGIPAFSMTGLNQTWGMIGAAIALVIGWIVKTVLYGFFTKRYFKINIMEKKSAIWATIFVIGISVLALLTKISFVLSVLGLVIFEVALAFKYRNELLNFARIAESYLLPSQKKVIAGK